MTASQLKRYVAAFLASWREIRPSPSSLVLIFTAIICFWLGYQAACFDVDMTGGPKTNPFSPYIQTDTQTLNNAPATY